MVVAGGAEAIELFDPSRDRFSTLAHTDAARLFATATAFGAGGTLVAGGYDSEIHPSAAATLIR